MSLTEKLDVRHSLLCYTSTQWLLCIQLMHNYRTQHLSARKLSQSLQTHLCGWKFSSCKMSILHCCLFSLFEPAALFSGVSLCNFHTLHTLLLLVMLHCCIPRLAASCHDLTVATGSDSSGFLPLWWSAIFPFASSWIHQSRHLFSHPLLTPLARTDIQLYSLLFDSHSS